MAKQDTYYFESFVKLVDYSVKAAEFLHNMITNFENDIDKLGELKDQIHEIEHEADLEKHTITEKLIREFLPPLDREDILDIMRGIDDVTDAIEDIVLRMYMYNVREVYPVVKEYTQVILDCTVALKELMVEFSNYKKSKKINQLIKDVLSYEEKCDKIYTDSVRELFINEKEPIKITIWHALYNRLEKCCDACGEVTSFLETAYMKNI